MVDRETLETVAKGYHDVVELQLQQRRTMALLLKTCVARLRSPDSRKRKEAIDALCEFAEMLDSNTPRLMKIVK